MISKKQKLLDKRERSRLAMAKLREERKAQGLCLWCGDPTVGYCFCERCRARGNLSKMDPNRDKYRQERGGVRNYSCGICGHVGHNKLTCAARQKIKLGEQVGE